MFLYNNPYIRAFNHGGEHWIDVLGNEVDPATVTDDGVYFKTGADGMNTKHVFTDGNWQQGTGPSSNNTNTNANANTNTSSNTNNSNTSTETEETIYADHDKAYDYKLIDGVWYTRKKGEETEWISLEDNEEATTKLNTAYPDAITVDNTTKNEVSTDNTEIEEANKKVEEGTDAVFYDEEFRSPEEANLLSGIGDTGLFDLIKAIDTTVGSFKKENYYDPGTKADYSKFSHTNTTDKDGLYVDQEALLKGKKTGDVLITEEQAKERDMQKFLDERHKNNPDKYSKVKNFDQDLYDLTGHLDYRKGLFNRKHEGFEGDMLENKYKDASHIGFEMDKMGNYGTAFDYLTQDPDGTFNQQDFDDGFKGIPFDPNNPESFNYSEEYLNSSKHNPYINYNQFTTERDYEGFNHNFMGDGRFSKVDPVTHGNRFGFPNTPESPDFKPAGPTPGIDNTNPEEVIAANDKMREQEALRRQQEEQAKMIEDQLRKSQGMRYGGEALPKAQTGFQVAGPLYDLNGKCYANCAQRSYLPEHNLSIGTKFNADKVDDQWGLGMGAYAGYSMNPLIQGRRQEGLKGYLGANYGARLSNLSMSGLEQGVTPTITPYSEGVASLGYEGEVGDAGSYANYLRGRRGDPLKWGLGAFGKYDIMGDKGLTVGGYGNYGNINASAGYNPNSGWSATLGFGMPIRQQGGELPKAQFGLGEFYKDFKDQATDYLSGNQGLMPDAWEGETTDYLSGNQGWIPDAFESYAKEATEYIKDATTANAYKVDGDNWNEDDNVTDEETYQIKVIQYPYGYEGGPDGNAGSKKMPPGHIEAFVVDQDGLPGDWSKKNKEGEYINKGYVNRWVETGNEPIEYNQEGDYEEGVRTVIMELNKDQLDNFMNTAQTFKEGKKQNIEGRSLPTQFGQGEKEMYDLLTSNCADGVCWALDLDDDKGSKDGDGGIYNTAGVTDPSKLMDDLLTFNNAHSATGTRKSAEDMASSYEGFDFLQKVAADITQGKPLGEKQLSSILRNDLNLDRATANVIGNSVGNLSGEDLTDFLLSGPVANLMNARANGEDNWHEYLLPIMNAYGTMNNNTDNYGGVLGNVVNEYLVKEYTPFDISGQGVENIPDWHYDNWIKPTGDAIEDAWEDTKDAAEDMWDNIKFWEKEGGELPKAQYNVNDNLYNTPVAVADGTYVHQEIPNLLPPEEKKTYNIEDLKDYNGHRVIGGTMPFVGTGAQLVGTAAESVYDYFSPEGGTFGDFMGWGPKADGGELSRAQFGKGLGNDFSQGMFADKSSGYNPLTNNMDAMNFNTDLSLQQKPWSLDMFTGMEQPQEETEPFFSSADNMYAMNQSVNRSMNDWNAFTSDMNNRMENPSLSFNQVETNPLNVPDFKIDEDLSNQIQMNQDKMAFKTASADGRTIGNTIIPTKKETRQNQKEFGKKMDETLDNMPKYEGTKKNLKRFDRSNELGFDGDLAAMDEYDNNESREDILRRQREKQLNEDNKDANPSFGDKLWNLKNRALDSKVGQTYSKIGAGAVRIAKPLNRMLEANAERKQKDTMMNNAYLSDNMWAANDADLTGSKGDYDVNTGIFRPDDKVVPGTTMTKYGGSFFNDGGEIEIDMNTYKQLVAAGAQIEII